jgi:hypothetical protein
MIALSASLLALYLGMKYFPSKDSNLLSMKSVRKLWSMTHADLFLFLYQELPVLINLFQLDLVIICCQIQHLISKEGI